MGSKENITAALGIVSAVGGCLTGSISDVNQPNEDYMNLAPQTEQVMVVDQPSNSFDLGNGITYDLEKNVIELPNSAESEMEGVSLSAVTEEGPNENQDSSLISSLNDLFNGGEENPEGGLVDGFSDLAEKIEEKQKNESKTPSQQIEYQDGGSPPDNDEAEGQALSPF